MGVVKKRDYDLAFGIGSACVCSDALRRAGFQYLTFPLDWVRSYSFGKNVELLLHDFADILPRDDLQLMMRAGNGERWDAYSCSRNEILFVHDFPRGKPFEEAYPIARDKLARRAERLLRLINEHRRILVVFVSVPGMEPVATKELKKGMRDIRARWPHAHFDLLYIAHANGHQFNPDGFEIIGENIWKIAYDICVPGVKYVGDRKAVMRGLRAFVRGVRDYRSEDERRSFKYIRRQMRFQRMNATNWCQYIENSFYWKVYRHLRNMLERRGFELS